MQEKDDIKLIKQNTSFKGDVARLVGGTIIAQIIGIITVPIISRYYSPNAYGILALFSSITTIISSIACWRYELAITVPEGDKNGAALFFTSILTTAITSSIVFFIFYYFNSIFVFLNAEQLIPYKLFIPAFVFINGIFAACNYWNTRVKRFGKVSLANIINSTFTRILNIILGLNGFCSGGNMIFALVFGQFVSTITIMIGIIKSDLYYLKNVFSISNIKKVIFEYIKFPLVSIWGILLYNVSIQLPPILLSFYFNSKIVGYFAFSYRLLSLPMSLIGSSISQVFFQRSSQAYHEGKLTEVTQECYTNLFLLGLFPYSLLAFTAPELFTIVFGEQWANAGIYSQTLAIWMFVEFTCAPITTLVETLNKQETGIFYTVMLVILRAVALVVGGTNNNINLTILLFMLAGVITYSLWSISLLKLAACKPIDTIFKAIKKSSITFLFIIIVCIIKYIIKLENIYLISSILFISVIYYICLLYTNPEFNKLVMAKLHKNHDICKEQ